MYFLKKRKKNMDKETPIFAITMGDPAGIGPEIALKALCSPSLSSDARIFIIGDLSVLNSAVPLVKKCPALREMNSETDFVAGMINVLDMKRITIDGFEPGKLQAQCGKASYDYVVKGIELCLRGSIGAIVTNPISKEAMRMAGISYPGHTEILADKTGTKDFSMMFALDTVHVAHVTTHIGLRQAIDLISKDRVLRHILLLHTTLLRLGYENPKIAVGGLNPHAGENGLFGNEESLHIIPAIEEAVKRGVRACGPYPPDTVFMRAFKGEFSGVVAMLHDHGFVALKSRDFENGVNITIGLPIIRTSVGHGTAFDIAGKGIARETSLLAAIKAARLLWEHRQ